VPAVVGVLVLLLGGGGLVVVVVAGDGEALGMKMEKWPRDLAVRLSMRR
jgi:hypothetical protein